MLLWAGEVGDLTEKTHELIFFDFIFRDNSKESLEEKTFWSLMVISNIFSLAKKKHWGFTSTYHAWKSVGYAHMAQKNFFPQLLLTLLIIQ